MVDAEWKLGHDYTPPQNITERNEKNWSPDRSIIRKSISNKVRTVLPFDCLIEDLADNTTEISALFSESSDTVHILL